jgi:Domain of unknown function (DUF4266)
MSPVVTLLTRSLLLLVLGSACTPVMAYERGHLAAPTMQPAYAESPARAHVRGVHEGALGGDLGVSSGCGCN